MAKLSGTRIIVNGIVALALALAVKHGPPGIVADVLYVLFAGAGALMVTLGCLTAAAQR